MRTRSFHIITFGCQMNVNDSGWISKRLQEKGFEPVDLPEAQLVVVNTCSVREKPEMKVRSTIGQIRQQTEASPDVCVAVTGCVAQQLGEALFSCSPQVRLVAGSDHTAQIPDALERLLQYPKEHICLSNFTESYEERPRPLCPASPMEFVNIMQGCDNFCTYCIVPYTKGRQKSRQSEAILAECRSLVSGGSKEITLLGQNVNAYGLDKNGDGTSFASLLCKVAEIPGLLRLRYVTPHPKDMTQEDVSLFGKLPSLCPRLHLPMQAGSDRVLKRMNRRYSSSDFLCLVDSLRKARPDIALSTDLIVGFPGETEEDFKETLFMVERCGFMSSFSFCYSDRPGTRASGFIDKIPAPVQLERLQRLQALQEEIGSRWLTGRIGSETDILLEKPSPRQNEGNGEEKLWQGKDPYGATVHVSLKDGEGEEGSLIKVLLTGAFKHSLQAVKKP